MKKVLLSSALLASTLLAGNIAVTGFAITKHKSDNRNENHNYIGAKYIYDLEQSLTFTSEVATFKNSYFDRASTFTMGLSYLPLEIKKVKVGANISIGVQKGYCMDNFTPRECKQGDEDIGLFFLPSLEVQYPLSANRNIGMNVAYTGAILTRFYFDIVSW